MIRTVTLTIPYEFDPIEADVSVYFKASPGRPSPNHIHPSDDDGEPAECDIISIDGKYWKCWSPELIKHFQEYILEHEVDNRTEAEMLADRGDEEYHRQKEGDE